MQKDVTVWLTLLLKSFCLGLRCIFASIPQQSYLVNWCVVSNNQSLNRRNEKYSLGQDWKSILNFDSFTRAQLKLTSLLKKKIRPVSLIHWTWSLYIINIILGRTSLYSYFEMHFVLISHNCFLNGRTYRVICKDVVQLPCSKVFCKMLFQ